MLMYIQYIPLLQRCSLGVLGWGRKLDSNREVSSSFWFLLHIGLFGLYGVHMYTVCHCGQTRSATERKSRESDDGILSGLTLLYPHYNYY